MEVLIGIVATLALIATWLAVGVVDREGEMPSRNIRAEVFYDLDNALEGGHFAEGEHCHGFNAEGLANDLIAFADDLCDQEPETLISYVREWMLDRGLDPDTGVRL